MPKINLKTDEVGCRKPGCKHRLEKTARHHRRCETMFIRSFEGWETKWYRKLCERYEEFRPKDVVVLCDWHHCEIHLIYDEAIFRDKRKRRKTSLVDYTQDEAKSLMRKLRDICIEWEGRETKGRDPKDCAPGRRFAVRMGKRVRKRRKRR